MISARRKEPMSSVLFDLRLHNRHQENLVSGRAAPVDEEADAPKQERWSIVTDDRQSGWYDPGYGVRSDRDGCLENEEPLSMRAAEALLERLEEGK